MLGPSGLRRLLPNTRTDNIRCVSSINPDTENYPDLVSADPEEYETHWHISPETIELAKRELLELPFARHLRYTTATDARCVRQARVDRFRGDGLENAREEWMAQIDDAYFGLTEIDDRAQYLIDQLTGVKSLEFEYCKFQGNISTRLPGCRQWKIFASSILTSTMPRWQSWRISANSESSRCTEHS